MKLKKIFYEKLNAKQKENHNFHKIAAKLTEYGFNTIRLSDDWQGADAIAVHVNNKDFIKVQIKGRLWFDKKYLGKKIWIAFHDKSSGEFFLYEHDRLLRALPDVQRFVNKAGGRSIPSPSKEQRHALKKYKL
jgi:hypothetical protein